MLLVTSDLKECIGRTPLLALKRLFPDARAKVYAKLEMMNPISIKDRAVLGMIEAAIQDGTITPQTEVVEASSGNTAIAVAMLGVLLDFKVKIFMSGLASVGRRKTICAYGATVVITPDDEHTKGARERAIRYCKEHPSTTMFLNQHSNPNNGIAHENTTGPEIWEQTAGALDVMVIGLGTAGTFDGLSRYLKSKNPEVKIVGFEPGSSPVYSGGPQGRHKIIGIGPGFVTDNFKRSEENLDELMRVPDEEAYEMTRRIARTEGLLVGPTSGAAAWACSQLVARSEYANKMILCFFYDNGERYLTTEGLFDADRVEYHE